MLETDLIRPKPTTHEGDVIELLEDLAKYGFTTGQRGVVISEFKEPSEAYDIAFEDSDGNPLGFAYSVKPALFRNISQETYTQGMELLLGGDLMEAERILQQAVALSPRLRGAIHNSIIKIFAEQELWDGLIPRLRLLVAIDPNYELARDSLAIAYLNYGVALAKQGKEDQALFHFQYAIECTTDEEIISSIRRNFAASFTNIGVNFNREGNFESSLYFMRIALLSYPNKETRMNVAKAHIHLALSYMNSSNYESALAAFDCAWQAGLELPELFNDYAIAMILTGHTDQGIRLFERALNLAPEDDVILKNLEKARELIRSDANALEQFNQEDYLSEGITSDFIPIPSVAHLYAVAA